MYCVVRKKEEHCYPIWFRSKSGGPTIRCPPRLKAKQGCSFRTADFGIEVWPTIVPTKQASNRRAADAQSKKRRVVVASRGNVADSEVEVHDPGATRPGVQLTLRDPVPSISTRSRRAKVTTSSVGTMGTGPKQAPGIATMTAPPMMTAPTVEPGSMQVEVAGLLPRIHATPVTV